MSSKPSDLRCKKCHIYGKEYKSIREVADVFGVSLPQLYASTRKYNDLKSGLEFVMSKGLKHGGKEYSSIMELCEEHGVTYPNFISRLRIGWSMEQALNTSVVAKKRTEYYFRGNYYENFSDLCRCYGIRKTLIDGFIRFNQDKYDNISLMDCFEFVIGYCEYVGIDPSVCATKFPSVRYNGKFYYSYIEFGMSVGLSARDLNYLVNKNTDKDILEQVKHAKSMKKSIYKYKGKIHSTVELRKLTGKK